MEAHTTKLERLLRNKEKIEREIAELKSQRNTALYDFIKSSLRTDIDPEILMGGLHYVMEQSGINPSMAEEWRQAGQKFLKKRRRPLQASYASEKAQPLRPAEPSVSSTTQAS